MHYCYGDCCIVAASGAERDIHIENMDVAADAAASAMRRRAGAVADVHASPLGEPRCHLRPRRFILVALVQSIFSFSQLVPMRVPDVRRRNHGE